MAKDRKHAVGLFAKTTLKMRRQERRDTIEARKRAERKLERGLQRIALRERS